MPNYFYFFLFSEKEQKVFSCVQLLLASESLFSRMTILTFTLNLTEKTQRSELNRAKLLGELHRHFL